VEFYIRIDNPKVGRPSSSEYEGATKVFLVNAFSAAFKDIPNPTGSGFRRENLGVAVALAGEGTVILPFMAEEFEKLVLDAQAKGKICDFSGDKWIAIVVDLVAKRKKAPSVDTGPSIPAGKRPPLFSFGPDIFDHPRYDGIKRAQRDMQEVTDRYGNLPYYDPRWRQVQGSYDRAVRDFDKSLRREFRQAQRQSVCQNLLSIWQHLTEPLRRTPLSPPSFRA
jgi:hypothetical protein